MKIDVEGTEEPVLRGMTRTLARSPSRRIVCETRAGRAADRLLKAADSRAVRSNRGVQVSEIICI